MKRFGYKDIIWPEHILSKQSKRLEKWLDNPPTFAPIGEVESVIERYFPGSLKNRKTGSHIRVKHECLRGQPNFGPDGGFDIPSVGGQKVKGCYLRLLAYAATLKKEHDERWRL